VILYIILPEVFTNLKAMNITDKASRHPCQKNKKIIKNTHTQKIKKNKAKPHCKHHMYSMNKFAILIGCRN